MKKYKTVWTETIKGDFEWAYFYRTSQPPIYEPCYPPQRDPLLQDFFFYRSFVLISRSSTTNKAAFTLLVKLPGCKNCRKLRRKIFLVIFSRWVRRCPSVNKVKQGSRSRQHLLHVDLSNQFWQRSFLLFCLRHRKISYIWRGAPAFATPNPQKPVREPKSYLLTFLFSPPSRSSNALHSPVSNW